MHSKAVVARALSEAFLAGTFDADELVARGVHLLGRILFVAMLHPTRGQRLRALFERIVW